MSGVAWTSGLQRLLVLVGRCIATQEPVLLVGPTGSGKTSFCQYLSLLLRMSLHIVNCHEHTETADFLGGLRPVRNKAALRQRFDDAVVVALQAAASVCWPLPASLPEGMTVERTDGCGDAEADADVNADNGADKASATQPPAREHVRVVVKSSTPVDDVAAAVKKVCAAVASPPKDETDAASANAEARAEVASLAKAVAAACGHAQALFEWKDGPLITAMKSGDIFLLDELSLAEDAVLERLNSVLEPSRSLLLAEKGGSATEEVVAAEDFRFIATMNPGGDFGKRELSPALRNRFTEIWVPALGDLGDLRRVVEERLLATAKAVASGEDDMSAAPLSAAPATAQAVPRGLRATLRGDAEVVALLSPFVPRMLWFVRWFNTITSGHLTPATINAAALSVVRSGEAAACSLPSPTATDGGLGGALASGSSTRALSFTVRDIVAWVSFVVRLLARTEARPWQAYVHGAAMVMLDGIGLGTGLSHAVAQGLQHAAYRVLHAQAPGSERAALVQVMPASLRDGAADIGSASGDASGGVAAGLTVSRAPGAFGLGPFLIRTGDQPQKDVQFALGAPTTAGNLLRVLRAMQVPKPVMLEGSPGVGKTTLIAALAKVAGHRLVRINLSEQTDIADLLGADLPAESDDGTARFAWNDGVFLRAMRAGDWVRHSHCVPMCGRLLSECLLACLWWH